MQLPLKMQPTAYITMLLFILACYITSAASSTASAPSQLTSHYKTNPSHLSRHQWSKRYDFPLSRSHPMRPATAFWDDDFASPEDFQKAADKGGALICALLGSDRTAGLLLKDKRTPPSAASIWTGDLTSELHEWYWRVTTPASKGSQMNKYWQIGAALRALGLDGRSESEGGNNVCYRIEHWDPSKMEGGKQVPAINQWYKVGEKDYRATKAHFEFVVNTKGGAIFGLYLDSPKSSARQTWFGNSKDPDLSLLPSLRSFSDIMWAYWVRNNPNVKNIRYLFMLGISNEQTNQLIASCLQKKEKTLSEWPGLTLDMGTDEGHALLGSPNGATFAYFLLQHKSQLGPKTISKVTILRPENDDDNDFVDASLIFHVVDTPEPPPDDEGGVVEKKGVARVGVRKQIGIRNEEKGVRYVVKIVEQGREDRDLGLVRTHEFRV